VAGSMVLAGVLLKLGGYGLYRFSCFFPFAFSVGGGYFLSFGLLGGLLSCFLCLRQCDLKSFVAYSSICHMGFGLAGLYSYVFYGFLGCLLILVAHGFCSSCLFYILYVLYKRYHSRSLLLIKGCLFLLPVLGLFCFIFFSFNMGVPPSVAFFSEVLIIISLGYLNFFLVFFCMMFLFLAGVYCIYLYVVSNHGVNYIDGLAALVRLREFLVFAGHLFPMLFLSLSS